MNLEELRRIREQERATDSLQNLRADFYADVAGYLAELRSERDTLASDVDDPFTDPEVKRLSDELQAAERTVEALYERRVGKIVKLASFAAADMAVEVEGLTTEEEDLFADIVETIQDFSGQITETLDAGDGPPADVTYRDETSATDDGAETEPEAPPHTAEPLEDESTDEPPDTDRTTVRITDEVGPIVGVDERNYDLAPDDIVTLPTENARPLIEGNVAEKVE